MNRLTTFTEKVPTQFGNLFAHVSWDKYGNVVDVSFSTPGKFQQSAVGDAVDRLAQAVTGLITGETK